MLMGIFRNFQNKQIILGASVDSHFCRDKSQFVTTSCKFRNDFTGYSGKNVEFIAFPE